MAADLYDIPWKKTDPLEKLQDIIDIWCTIDIDKLKIPLYSLIPLNLIVEAYQEDNGIIVLKFF